ncbi:universal stress protein [Demequina capsici]|uniref:Universal stress protein n=1 Tax=Demequina capsici TaxID=3075620 RepID=A0AA96FD15_9MICO|nr:universal stress protein [Demequina sp. PMTSA13]WNM27888.1 universal stress protein [Demequina sp. PMTSA13]
MTEPWRGPVLVAVNDSEASFHAADVAIAHARAFGAPLRAVAVVEHDGLVAGSPEAVALESSRDVACAAALAQVERLATRAGVPVVAVKRHGRVAAEILAEATACGATLIVLGRMERPGHVVSGIGSHTMHVVEFAPLPVLVVPPDAA